MAERFRKKRPDRVTRLAEAIDALCERDDRLIEEAKRVERLRLRGAQELHALCREFVDEVNSKMRHPALILSPAEFSDAGFQEEGANLLQINLRGRLLQLEFHTMEDLISTDDFRVPYVLRGSVRSFNQELLDSNRLDEQMIFYCPKGDSAMWLFFDHRTYRTGDVDRDYLGSALERLI